jgi:hypothetical protein
VFLSTRISDWGLSAVREAIERWLLHPMRMASGPKALGETDTEEVSDKVQAEAQESIQLREFALDALSESDAQRLAEFYGAKPAAALWAEVIRGAAMPSWRRVP